MPVWTRSAARSTPCDLHQHADRPAQRPSDAPSSVEPDALCCRICLEVAGDRDELISPCMCKGAQSGTPLQFDVHSVMLPLSRHQCIEARQSTLLCPRTGTQLYVHPKCLRRWQETVRSTQRRAFDGALLCIWRLTTQSMSRGACAWCVIPPPVMLKMHSK